MNVRYRVTLSTSERVELVCMVLGGEAAVRKLKRAEILLAADKGSNRRGNRQERRGRHINRPLDEAALRRGRARTRLTEAPRVGGERQLDIEDEALLIAVACSKAPAGRARWTLQLLADEMVRLTGHASVSSETIRRRLNEFDLKPLPGEGVVHPQGRRGVRRPHGGRAVALRRARR
jgi:hypothetical protein